MFLIIFIIPNIKRFRNKYLIFSLEIQSVSYAQNGAFAKYKEHLQASIIEITTIDLKQQKEIKP